MLEPITGSNRFLTDSLSIYFPNKLYHCTPWFIGFDFKRNQIFLRYFPMLLPLWILVRFDLLLFWVLNHIDLLWYIIRNQYHLITENEPWGRIWANTAIIKFKTFGDSVKGEWLIKKSVESWSKIVLHQWYFLELTQAIVKNNINFLSILVTKALNMNRSLIKFHQI